MEIKLLALIRAYGQKQEDWEGLTWAFLPAKARILLNEELAISNLKFSSNTLG